MTVGASEEGTQRPGDGFGPARLAATIAENVETVIVGKRRQIEYVVAALLCRGHVLIEDVPGTGKTMLARAMAISLGLSFNRVQCTPDLLPNDVTGSSIFNQQNGSFEFRPGPLFTNVLLVDEINRATPRTQSAFLESMQERQVSIEQATRKLPDPFLLIATQNPIEFEGTFPLPEAQVDRFLIRLPLGYPEPEEEIEMLRRLRRVHPIELLRPAVGSEGLRRAEEVVGEVFVSPVVERYIMALVTATRNHADLSLGASPRGSLALFKTSQALAAIRGRDYVLPDDVKEVARLVLPHRLSVKAGSRVRGRDAATVVREILEDLPLDLEEEG